MIRKLEVRCNCGEWGRLTWTGRKQNEKDICKFVCQCNRPSVDFENPYFGYTA